MNAFSVLIALFLSFGLLSTVSAGINDGLVAYYPFDGNAKDMSGNGNDGTEYGGVTYCCRKIRASS